MNTYFKPQVRIELVSHVFNSSFKVQIIYLCICRASELGTQDEKLKELDSELDMNEKVKGEIDLQKFQSIENYLIEAPMAIQLLGGLMWIASKM